MIIYLSALSILRPYFENGTINPKNVDCLASFYGISDIEIQNIPRFNNFMLDSGAFSFMRGKSVSNWDVYIEKYAQFINQNNVKRFMELDIDSIVGLKEVERLRAKLERLTNKQSIPVWHFNRGKEYFIDMCQNYSYIAIGGLVKTGMVVKLEDYFPWFIRTAHEHNCKIHGLGYTKLEGLKKYHFDSVDSTTWNVGAKYGNVCIIKPNQPTRQIHRDMRCVDSLQLNYHNFYEWWKFQRYAEKML